MPNECAKAYKDGYEQGVKDFAKYLIDKSKHGVVSVMDIPDYVKAWCDNNAE